MGGGEVRGATVRRDGNMPSYQKQQENQRISTLFVPYAPTVIVLLLLGAFGLIDHFVAVTSFWRERLSHEGMGHMAWRTNVGISPPTLNLASCGHHGLLIRAVALLSHRPIL